jgi:hypothetical protein
MTDAELWQVMLLASEYTLTSQLHDSQRFPGIARGLFCPSMADPRTIGKWVGGGTPSGARRGGGAGDLGTWGAGGLRASSSTARWSSKSNT